jgi:hypothetical protein
MEDRHAVIAGHELRVLLQTNTELQQALPKFFAAAEEAVQLQRQDEAERRKIVAASDSASCPCSKKLETGEVISAAAATSTLTVHQTNELTALTETVIHAIMDDCFLMSFEETLNGKQPPRKSVANTQTRFSRESIQFDVLPPPPSTEQRESLEKKARHVLQLIPCKVSDKDGLAVKFVCGSVLRC